MDIWKTILTWAMYKREKLGRKNGPYSGLDRRYLVKYGWIDPKVPSLEKETQALERFFDWVRRGGMEALERAECVLDERKVKPTDIEQHTKQLLALMEKEYWISKHCTVCLCFVPVALIKEIFKTMLEEIPKLIGMHQRLGLRNFTIEARFLIAFDKILRLSSWTPSSTRNEHLRELLRNALLIINDLGGSEEYHDYLRDFMMRHADLYAFTPDNAGLVINEDTETTAELCKNLQRLAQNLKKIVLTKAEQYQKLYEDFMDFEGELSLWLDLASPGQGKLYIWFRASARHIFCSCRSFAVRQFHG